jgi:16S rRNA (guanine527-N7)-methyltransferase
LADLSAACGLRLEARATAGLLGYLDMLERWNSVYNLTSVRTRDGMWTQHLADCLALIPALARRMTAGRVLDVGSGGGLPGVVIAACLPAVEVVCVDAVGKKAAFVRQVAGELGLQNLQAVRARVEQMRDGSFDVITSRAFASLADFVTLSRSLLAPDGAWLAMKGKVPDDEISSLPADVEVFHVEPLTVPGLDAQRCLIWLQSRAHT